ncbi:MAG: DUF4355 domain-containing protein [Tissierellia bacterium]|nr:DUF4355 domain-containing protein [Tissierellia bacterium]
MSEENKKVVTDSTESLDTTDQEVTKNEDIKKEGQKKYTDEDVDRIINKKFAKWQKEQELAVQEAKKLEKMNKDEKTEYKMRQLEKKLEEYKQRETLSQMSRIAKNMLAEDGYNVSDELLEKIVTQDAESTKENVLEFRDLIKNEIEKGINERLKGESPRVKTSQTRQKSFKDLYKIKDTVKRREELMKL